MAEKVEIDGMAFELRDGAVALTGCDSEATSISVPREVCIGGSDRPVVAIGERAFQGLPLISAKIPQGVIHIAEEAFSGCQSLESVSLPPGLEFIGRKAFYGCISLAQIEMPEGVQCIG